MALTFAYPPKPERGDAVAVLSPSWGGPSCLPDAIRPRLDRLRDEFGLRPVEYLTTRAAQASPAERAGEGPARCFQRSRDQGRTRGAGKERVTRGLWI